MGCFSYRCDGCGGRKCNQSGGQSNECISIIEVHLKDGTTVFLQGEYGEYGHVDINLNGEIYEFYPLQFEKYFKDWIENTAEKYRCQQFVAGKIYTVSEKVHISEIDDETEDDIMITKHRDCAPYSIKVVPLTEEIIRQCTRPDEVVKMLTAEQYYATKIIENLRSNRWSYERMKNNADDYKKEIEEINSEIKKLEEILNPKPKEEPKPQEKKTVRKKKETVTTLKKNSNI
jgi:hypothetical protein